MDIVIKNPLGKESVDDNDKKSVHTLEIVSESESNNLSDEQIFNKYVNGNKGKHLRNLLCAWESLFCLLITIFISGSNFVWYNMRGGERPLVWIHIIMGMIGIFIILICFIETLIKARMQRLLFCHNCAKNKCLPKNSTGNEESSMMWFYKAFFTLDGEFYLVKMYIFENFEIIWQFYTYFSIYSCSMPMIYLTTIACILMAESAFSIWSLFHLTSSTVRNRQILLDIFTDIFCMGFPTISLFYVFFVPMTINQVLQCICMPALLVYSKLFELWVDIIEKKQKLIKEKIIAKKNQRMSKRVSVTELTVNQANRLPKLVRNVFLSANIIYILAWTMILLIQIFATPQNDFCQEYHTKEIWNGCKIHVPFCNSPFTPKCNCAVLQITNYSSNFLPEPFSRLDGLVKVEIIFGKLKELPEQFGYDHNRMMHIDLTGNILQSLPGSLFSGPPNLFRVMVSDNKLVKIPSTISESSELWYFKASHNNLTTLPFSPNTKMPQLSYLDLRYNGIREILIDLAIFPVLIFFQLSDNKISVVPKSIRKLKNLESLWLQNNKIEKIEDQALCDINSLKEVGMWNNDLVVIPSCLTQSDLIFFDIRYNKIKSIDAGIFSWCKNLEYCRMSNNPACNAKTNTKEHICEQACSMNCVKPWLGNDYCDDEHYYHNYYKFMNSYASVAFSKDFLESLPRNGSGCNTKQCNYDYGDCGI
jgi:Leucine-rich repeat (LRR) protein